MREQAFLFLVHLTKRSPSYNSTNDFHFGSLVTSSQFACVSAEEKKVIIYLEKTVQMSFVVVCWYPPFASPIS